LITSSFGRVVVTLIAGFLPLQALLPRLRGRGTTGPIGPAGNQAIEFKKATCTGANYEYHTACTEGWWEHWWDGVQYCSDAKANCELHGGKFVIND
jgi:hypothetical protein